MFRYLIQILIAKIHNELKISIEIENDNQRTIGLCIKSFKHDSRDVNVNHSKVINRISSKKVISILKIETDSNLADMLKKAFEDSDLQKNHINTYCYHMQSSNIFLLIISN